MRCRRCQPLPDEVARAADLVGKRWVLQIVWAASEAEASRFNEFKQVLVGIPPRTLAQRLQELEQAGVLEREVVDARRVPADPGGPPPHPGGAGAAAVGWLSTARS
jgi:DNA-binding HxlR family transcriptional regulator